MAEAALTLSNVRAGYGASVVIDGLSLRIERGETVAILGRNGVGKTTLLSTIMGHTRHMAGQLDWGRQPIAHWPIWRRSRAGVALVPQEREIFPSLTVQQNLEVAQRAGHRGTRWSLDDIWQMFPRLKERAGNLGNQLSGGEQQMLAMARALMGSPELLMLDEPLEGLAPIIVEALMQSLCTLRDQGGMTMLLVEQHARLALNFAPRAIVLVRGAIAYDGPSQTLLDDDARLQSLIGVG